VSDSGPTAAVVEALVENHRGFLAFLERRVGSRADAEDILQAAFVRGVEKSGTLRETDRAVAWFYRLLRNAIVDHYRRSGTEARLFAGEPDGADAPAEPEVEDAICACIRRLLPTLKPGYAEMIDRVDLGEEPLASVADGLGISPNNAAVRLHRARAALRRRLEQSCGTCATHGCLDCGCGA